MKNIGFLLVGILFGIVMSKSEAISWFRIQEMFRFQSFHMYGIIGTAVTMGALMHYMLRKIKFTNIDGQRAVFGDKPKTYYASIGGGIVFGLGWAMTGACPGPLYVLLGQGFWIIGVIIISAFFGTVLYGMLQKHLPH